VLNGRSTDKKDMAPACKENFKRLSEQMQRLEPVHFLLVKEDKERDLLLTRLSVSLLAAIAEVPAVAYDTLDWL